MRTTAANAFDGLARGARRLTGFLVGCLLGVAAWAHPMPESKVWIDAGDSGWHLTMLLPLNRLEYGFGQPLADRPGFVLREQGPALAAYVLRHVKVEGAAGPWRAGTPQLQVVGDDTSPELAVELTLTAPRPSEARHATLVFDAITHEVRTHRVMVYLRNDWVGGFAGRAPVVLGELMSTRTTLDVPLAAHAPFGAAFASLLSEGMQHIRDGSDHLLFLLTLLLVAPLGARHGRWRETRGVGAAIRQVALVVSAFTLGHTLTLGVATLDDGALPSQPIEIAVAVSILVAAVHAVKPLMASGEVNMAAAFGLVHGLAFSSALSLAGLTSWQHLQALLAFNLGVEVMQLIVVVLAMPPLLMLARCAPALYGHVRMALALGAVAVSLCWIGVRSGIGMGQMEALIDQGAQRAPYAVAGLWMLAAVTAMRARTVRGRRWASSPSTP